MPTKMRMPYHGTVTVEDFDGNKTTVNLQELNFYSGGSDPEEVGSRDTYKVDLYKLSGGATLCMDIIVYSDGGYKMDYIYVESSEDVDASQYKIDIDIEP